MRQVDILPVQIRVSTIGIARLLITSYFIALGLGLVAGTDVRVLLVPVSYQLAEGAFPGVLLVALASMVLFGILRSYATVALGLLVFWASYLTMMIQPGDAHVAGFWRDLALISGLLLSHGKPSRSIAGISFGLAPRRQAAELRSGPVMPIEKTAATSAQAQLDGRHTTQRPAHPRRVRTEIYRQDFEVVRVR